MSGEKGNELTRKPAVNQAVAGVIFEVWEEEVRKLYPEYYIAKELARQQGLPQTMGEWYRELWGGE